MLSRLPIGCTAYRQRVPPLWGGASILRDLGDAYGGSDNATWLTVDGG